MTEVVQQTYFHGGGSMGAMMRAYDWSRTSVGSPDNWPTSLHTALSILLDSGYPMLIAWGRDYLQFYNDAYRPILGTTKHPGALGTPTPETFPEIWDFIGPMFDKVMDTGVPSTFTDLMVPLDRNGFLEECYFTFSYSAIRDQGRVGGVFVTVLETTDRTLRERRESSIQRLAAISARGDIDDICIQAADVLDDNVEDMPFVALISATSASQRVICSSCPEGLTQNLQRLVESIPDTAQTAITTHDLEPRVLPPWPEPVTRVAVVPVVPIGHDKPLLYMLVGISPRLMFNADYENFLKRLGDKLATLLTEAEAFEAERRRAESLAELDRAKTVFFSNVSHEFRTPLTLMLGPLRELLDTKDALPQDTVESVEMVQRNAKRLHRMVNTLLDFSRIEAGRVEAVYEKTPVSQYTRDLAGMFRSIIEQAGLDYDVDCEDIDAPVFVDREMWEKIVFNLLSNALKFTLEGGIRVRLRQVQDSVELTVTDTGVGIPEKEQSRVFERFHRVQGLEARTHEGTGIGLALVRELVSLHGGRIEVESQVGQGACFRVRIPLGSAHLPAERIGASRQLASTALGGEAYIEEARDWLPGSTVAKQTAQTAASPRDASADSYRARIVLADDNADMREYVSRLLGDRWEVEAVADGAQALEAIRRHRPDLVLTDVMMPNLDGFELLQAIRDDGQLRSMPVIMLSARAGEEARIEGLNRGADDYLTKPFPARELIARIDAQLERSRLLENEGHLQRRLMDVFRHAPVGVALLRGPQHIFEYINPEYQNIVGDRNLIGRSAREAFPEIEGQGFFELLDECYATGYPYVGRSAGAQLNNALGELEQRYFDFTFQPVRASDGAINGIAVVAYEVTAVVQARQAAEQANLAKDEFLAMLGHELRNPLAPILTALELMRLSGDDAFKYERSILERQARYLVRLIEDLMDVSRISRGDIVLKMERLKVADVVEMALETVRPLLDQHKHQVQVDIPPTPLEVLGDSVRLGQILSNLLTNAARYTDSGGRIELRVEAAGEQVLIEVSDNGIGIDSNDIDSIFEIFVQARKDPSRVQGGLGLGLAIANSLAARHGGSLVAHSDGIGHGSRFELRLPLVPPASVAQDAQPAAQAESAKPPLQGPFTLIVDDNRDAADMLAMGLNALGHETQVVYDGAQALALLNEESPDVAVLDIGLPGMDGLELARRLRQRPQLRNTLLVALTGYGQARDRDQSLDAGFDAHLVKPVDLQALDTLIRERSGAARPRA